MITLLTKLLCILAVPFDESLCYSIGQLAKASLPPRALSFAKMPIPKHERT